MKCVNLTLRKGRPYCKANPGCQCAILEPEKCGDYKARGGEEG